MGGRVRQSGRKEYVRKGRGKEVGNKGERSDRKARQKE